jgi:hypothetical protein
VGAASLVLVYTTKTTAYQSRKFAMVISISSTIPGGILLFSRSKYNVARAKFHAYSLLIPIAICLLWTLLFKVQEFFILSNGQDPTLYFPKGIQGATFWIIAFPLSLISFGFLLMLLAPWIVFSCWCRESYLHIISWLLIVGFCLLGFGWGVGDAIGLSTNCINQGPSKGYMFAIISAIELLAMLGLSKMDNRELTKDCYEQKCGGQRQIINGHAYCCHKNEKGRLPGLNHYPFECRGPVPDDLVIVQTLPVSQETMVQLL